MLMRLLQPLPMDSGGWLSGGAGDPGVSRVPAGGYDSALAILDGLAQPFLDPFVEGLKVWSNSLYAAALKSSCGNIM